LAVTVEFTHAIRPLVKAKWTVTLYEVPGIADPVPAPPALPETAAPGGRGLPMATGQFLNKRPLDGAAPEQSSAGIGVRRLAVMLETVRPPVFWRVISHVPVPV
jgi:hypothetical protein